MLRGEVYYVDLSPVIGSEQGGYRPCVAIQNDDGNRYSSTTIIAPMTTQTKKTIADTCYDFFRRQTPTFINYHSS